MTAHEFRMRESRKAIYAKWFDGKITYDEMIYEIAQVH
jgi:hypothetical protein